MPTCSTTSKSRDGVLVQFSRIAEAQQYLRWHIQTERDKGLSNKAQNVWSRYSDMEEEFFKHKLTSLLASSDGDIINKSLYSSLQNMLKDFKKSLLVLTREVMDGEDKGKSMVVVGAGGMFQGQRGGNSHAETVKSIKFTTDLWLEKFVAKCKREGVVSACTSLREAEKAGEKRLRDVYEEFFASRVDLIFINVEDSKVPTEALECFSTISNGEELGKAKLWLRTRKRCHAGLQNERERKVKRKEMGEKLICLLRSVKSTCLLENNYIAGLLSLYNKKTWLDDKEKVMGRAWASIDVWPFISFDDEGHGMYFQVGFFGSAGWECVVFGPAFFPKEMMELLESPRTIVTGKNIHHDLCWILGSEAGWRAVDLGVWTRDLKFHGHNNNGLKRMFQESVGFKEIKISKDHPEDREMFGYIRTGNWNKEAEKLDSRQLTYMAADVTLPGTVVFDLIITLISELGVATLDQHYESLEEFVAPYVINIIDRRFNEKLQHSSHSIPVEIRSLRRNVAAIALSEEIINQDEVSDEHAEARRERAEEQIQQLGEEKLAKATSFNTPMWLRPPEERGERGRHLVEKVVVEESWE